MDRLLLMDDDDELRVRYRPSLEKAGFEVVEIDDGSKLEKCLQQEKFNVILSDTEMPELDGYLAIERAIDKKLMGFEIMVVGMSEVHTNQDNWRGIANFDCFFEKNTAEDIGEYVRRRYNEFASGNVFACSKMPKFDW